MNNVLKDMTLTDTQRKQLEKLRSYFPFRIVYGAVSEGGVFTSGAVSTMRTPDKLTRSGYTVWLLKG